MQIQYTRHAKRRMKWRKVSEAEVKEILINPDKIIKSITDGKIKALKNIHKRLLQIVYIKKGNKFVIISVINKSD